MWGKYRLPVFILFVAVLFALALIPLKSYASRLIYKMEHYLPDNLYVDQVGLGGKTLLQAEEILNKMEAAQLSKSLAIHYDDGAYTQSSIFTYEQLGYFAEKEKLLTDLKRLLGHDIHFVKRFIAYQKIEKSGAVYLLNYAIHYDRFLKAMAIFEDASLQPPVDARYSITKGKVSIVKEENGYIFDKDALYKELLANRELTSFKLASKAVKPNVTSQQLESQGIKEMISSFTTKFDAGNVPRSSNIRLAAKMIDGTILAPGGVFSFNGVVGERTRERGFQEAGVYMNGRVDTGIGGGICQVSTTLYNAVLFANLEVLERSNHSLTVPYVPLSRDAAVSWGAQDFKFRNNTKYYIYIRSAATAYTVTFELYSTKSDAKVELESKTLSKISAPVVYLDDASIELGQQYIMEKGHDGYQSQLTKKVYQGGSLVSSEVLSKDKYQTSVQVVKRGTKIITIDDIDI
jgi:vancomycin resistance protein YoaR